MSTSVRFPLLLILLLLNYAVPSCAEAATGTMALTVRDVQTGYGVSAHVILQQSGESTAKRATDGAGSLLFASRPGRIGVRIEAAGYVPLATYFLIEAGQSSEIEILLDPLIPAPELRAKRLAALELGADEAVWHGYVVDDRTGRPIEGVRVEAGMAGTADVSDARGHFLVTLPAHPVQEEERVPTTALIFRREGYKSLEMERLTVQPGVMSLPVRLEPGSGRTLRKAQDRWLDTAGENAAGDNLADLIQAADAQSSEPRQAAAENLSVLTAPVTSIAPPSSIRVGLNCASKLSCSSVSVMSLESYVQTGLNDEWFPTWFPHSLRAGAVAYRTYGAYHTRFPLTGTYDICSSASCQVWDSDLSTSSSQAAQYTSGIMLESGGQIAFSEYSAENNDQDGALGCGDCFCGSPSAGWSCLFDSVGCGFARNGHGRGMSQWGTQRWATQGQIWTWITNHYYKERPTPKLSVSSPLALNSASPSPASVSSGSSFTVNINATNSAQGTHNQILIGASLCAPTCNISDSAHDVKVSLAPGTSNVSRTFQVPPGTAPGVYDLLVAFWFDGNEDNVINPEPGDLILASKLVSGAVTVQGCSVSISPPSQSFSSGGGSGSFSVTAQSGCSWSATTSAGWITISSGTGSGSGTVSFNVAANAGSSSRSGTIQVGGQTFTINQAGVSCSYSLSPPSQSFSSGGGSGSFSVTTQNGCSWSATTSAGWITISSGTGSGSGTVSFNVAANSGSSSRSGTIQAGGQTFTVTESGVSCSYSISPASQSFSSGGGSGGFSVTTQGGCSWTATTSAGWINITSGTGTGNGSVSFSVAANSGSSSRSGTISAAGQSFTVSQSGGGGTSGEIFHDDLESGSGSWFAQAPWALTTADAHSPAHSWTDSPGGNYDNEQNVTLFTRELDLSNVNSALLTFWHRYDLEEGFDFGNVWVTADGGVSYTHLRSFTGRNQAWSPVTLDLTPFAGQPSVILAFQLLSDEIITADGWSIDDIEVYVRPSTHFFTVTPCRLADTRQGTPLVSGAPQVFQVTGSCGIPATAKAVSFNITAVDGTGDGYVTLFAPDEESSGTGTINFRTGRARSNNTVLRLSVDGALAGVSTVPNNGQANLILDVNGYFE